MLFWRGRWPLVASLAAIVLVGVLLQPVNVLTMATDNGSVLACRRMQPGSTATLVFTHSMYGGEVRETWRVDGSMLDRVRIETDNAAAAEYYAFDGKVEATEGGFEVFSPPLQTGALPVRVDQIGQHRLRFGADEVSLSDRLDGSVGATMSVTRMALIEWFVGSGCRHP
jgi:hypothetical protein